MPESQKESSLPDGIEPYFGTAVSSKRYYQRPAVTARLVQAMTQGNGATMFGLRRTGKSSEAGVCAEALKKERYLVVHIDAQGMTSEEQILAKFLSDLPKDDVRDKITAAIRDNPLVARGLEAALKTFTGVSVDIRDNFDTVADAISKVIAHNKIKVALIVDELPFLLRNILEADTQNGKRRVNGFLAALRRWRGQEGHRGIPMLLLGSIGMLGLIRSHGLEREHTNDLRQIAVPPLATQEEAAAFIGALARGGKVKGWTDQHTAVVVDESAAWYPGLLQAAFQELTPDRTAPDTDAIPKIFSGRIRPDVDWLFYSQFDRRRALHLKMETPLPALLGSFIDTIVPATAPIPWQQLRALAQANIQDAQISDALDLLREDDFIDVHIAKGGETAYLPASPLAEFWWKQRRGSAK